MTTIYSLPQLSQVDPGGSHLQDTWNTGIEQWVQDYDEICDFCARQLEPPAILHVTLKRSLWFHHSCAEQFGLALIKDAARTNYSRRKA